MSLLERIFRNQEPADPPPPAPQLSADEEERLTRANYNTAYRLWWDHEKKHHNCSVVFGPALIFGERSDAEGERLTGDLHQKRLLWYAAQEKLAATKSH